MRRVASFLLRCQIANGVHSGTRLDTMLRHCGAGDSQGINEVQEWRDWTHQETTPDQARIEDLLEATGVCGLALLHVGVGNSSLAKRFCNAAIAIDGLTIQENEYALARELRLPHYQVRLQSKFAENLAADLNRRYHYIIDNNPTTFGCCRWHVAAMMANYAALLTPGGVILTDTVGLGWTSQPNDPGWQLTDTEWWTFGQRFGLSAIRYSDFVIGLEKGSRWREAQQTLRGLSMRLVDGRR